LDASTLWEAVRGHLRSELGWIRTQWLEGLELRGLERGTACLVARSEEARLAASERTGTIRAAFAELGAPVKGVRIAAARARSRARRKAAVDPTGEAPDEPDIITLCGDGLNDRFQLSAFLTGPGNEVPLRVARQVIEQPGMWNPLVFWGGSGNGKTHLLHGIAHDFRRRYPGRRVVYASSERFVRQYSLTARRRQAIRFRELYRQADLLVLDDVQELAGKPGSERELVFTLDHLTAAGRQVVLSSSASPKRIGNIEPTLGGRLLGGLTIELPSPDRTTRRSIIHARCASSGLCVPEPVVELLLAGFGQSTRELLDALTRLEAFVRHLQRPLDVPAAQHILADLLGGRLRAATLESLAEFVAERTGVGVDAQRGRSRKPTVVAARQLAMALAREHTSLTLREVGAFFGARSCASVHFAQERVRTQRKADTALREVWEAAAGLFTRPDP
jgi:chromosomal replication initiator protein